MRMSMLFLSISLGSACCAPPAAAEASLCSPPRDGWEVTRDDEPEEASFLNSEAHRIGSPVFARGTALKFRLPKGAVAPDAAKRRALDRWNRRIEEVFRDMGFRTPPNAKEVENRIDMLFDDMPYNTRRSMAATRGPVLYLVNDVDARCTNYFDEGMLGAYSFMSYPEPGVGSDWGSVTVTVVGIGRCGPDSAEAMRIAGQTVRTVARLLCRETGASP